MNALNFLAEVHPSVENPASALQSATEALKLCEDTQNVEVEASAQLMCGSAHLMLDSSSKQGVTFLKKAAALFSTAGDIKGMSSTFHMLANVHLESHDVEEASNCAKKALACYQCLG